MQDLLLVNASHILSDRKVKAMVKPLQTQFDRDFIPAWGERAVSCRIGFAGINDIPDIPHDIWCIFMNKHSLEADALGWHDDLPGEGRVYARVFIGDCIRLGLNYEVTVSHEALEMSLDPDVKRVWRMPDGRLASLEACDAVESDELSYDINGMEVSNFVLPSYFSTGEGPYDHRGALKAPCPALAPGGYMILSDDAGGWSQIYANKVDGLPGRRALFKGHRRMVRRAPGAMEVLA